MEMARDSRLIPASTFFVLGAAVATLVLASIVEDNTLQLLINLVVTPVATLAAAYAGARIAFGFQSKKDHENEISQNVRAANTTIFQLVRFAYLFHVIEKQYIAEHRNNQARHFQIDAGMEYGIEELHINFDSLAFLFNSPKPDLLRTLAAVQLEINATVGVIRQRQHWHVEKFQVAMDSVPVGVALTSNEVEALVGERIAITLKKQTDDIIEGVDASIAGLRSHIDNLRDVVKAMYPAHGVVFLQAPSS
ncbi:hypothetical protein MQC88_11410 [Luteimonas sp. 50]|uniref:Uncharacterized protein n=1 Tax=Cognatiluteimonas sedimenti TaxID=2927791 RepID=A0ABT0A6H8_9GAMM|nr:hypothetical protein [Lysobacter sedimenti]MCJ0826550.1 hypothetical protein [Lysobacter sedimenti]